MLRLLYWLLTWWNESPASLSLVPSARRPRLWLETLEDRTALSVFPFAGGDALTTVGGAGGHGAGCPCCMGCGCSSSQSDSYRFGGSNSSSTRGAYKWSQSALGQPVTITYSYSNLLNGQLVGGMSATTIRRTIEEALGRWAAVAPLRFVEVADRGPTPSTTDYNGSGLPMMRFGHLPIDGANNILAYAYYPGLNGLSGDVLFDRAERWATSPTGGMDLLEVATHEIGHALGLNHEPMPDSGGKSAIMNPYYAGRFSGLGTSYLLPDDVAGIRALYGTGVGWVRPLVSSNPNPSPSPSPDPTPPNTPTPDPSFAIQGTTLLVMGTTGNDTFRFVGTTNTIEINGRAFAGSLTNITTIRFDGRGGADTLSLVGSSALETFSLTPGAATLSGGRFRVEGVALRTVTANAGLGDALIVTGTSANETFVARPTGVSVASAGRTLVGLGFGQVTLNSGGGSDTVHLHGSAGNDNLAMTPTQVTLSGPGYSVTANAFPTVEVFASAGNDFATLTGSTGNDTFVGRTTVTRMSGPGYYIGVNGFDRVTANTLLGNDIGRFFDGPGNDSLVMRPRYARLSGPGYSTEVTGVARVDAYAGSGGIDSAQLIGSVSDEVFRSIQGIASLQGPDYLNVAYGFRTVTADGNGGNDRAQITGSATGIDTVSGSGAVGQLVRPTDAVVFTRFQSVTMNGTTGINRRRSGPFSFAVVWLGVWS